MINGRKLLNELPAARLRALTAKARYVVEERWDQSHKHDGKKEPSEEEDDEVEEEEEEEAEEEDRRRRRRKRTTRPIAPERESRLMYSLRSLPSRTQFKGP